MSSMRAVSPTLASSLLALAACDGTPMPPPGGIVGRPWASIPDGTHLFMTGRDGEMGAYRLLVERFVTCFSLRRRRV